jgi:hypothetical protein
MAEALSQSSPQTASCKPPEPPPPLMTSRRDDLKHGHRLVLDDRQAVREELPEHLVIGTGPYGRINPDPAVAHRRTTAALHLGGNRSGRHVITRGANTARSTLAIAYGTLSADQKPRSVSGDNAPPSTRNPIPRGATSSRKKPAQRTPALHRLRTRICPSSIEATIKIKNALKKIVWPMSLSVLRAVTV